ncbi:MAG: hypothetical protein IPP94_14980 [Ignavibacteria bacterium]|nr:hypothetical protein [Ignavibacteria bacterium]
MFATRLRVGQGIKEQAAKALNIGLSSLYRKIDELDIGAGDLKGA